MSGIVGSKLNIRGSGRIAKLGTDGQLLTSGGAGVQANYEDAPAGGTSWQSVVTASTLTAVAGNGYPIDTSSNACTVTLPASASVGDTIQFVDYARNWGTNALTIDQNSLNYQGNTSPNPVYDTSGLSVSITYVDTTKGWIPTVDDDVAMETPQPYSADLLVVAGGAAGGSGNYCGGGGAGGYIARSSVTLTGSSTYTVTVGAGGAGVPADQGGSGGNSIISGTGLTTSAQTSAGGGGGGSTPAGTRDGAAGGSGGGAGYHHPSGGSGGAGDTPATTPAQGFAGGTGYGVPGNDNGGGGGGASEVGENGQAGTMANGGDGNVTTIMTTTMATDNSVGEVDGSDVYFGGGGAAGGYDIQSADGGKGGGGSGGLGGTGQGSLPHAKAGDGTTNTGGGGGGDTGTTPDDPGLGGSGCVVIKCPTASYSGSTTGSPDVDTDGSDTIITFTGDGTYTG